MKKRYFAKRPKGLPKGYDSKLEHDLHLNELAGYDHHPDKVNYKIEHTYEPDFVHPDEPNILIEVKGRFRDATEAAKYVWIQKCNPDIEIVFIFQKPETPMPFAKVRKKCGTKRSHAEWATKNKFRWYTRETFNVDLSDEEAVNMKMVVAFSQLKAKEQNDKLKSLGHGLLPTKKARENKYREILKETK